MSDKFVVDIKDFQSLKEVHLDLPKGVTIITGKTNEGKSSVFRAIDSALFNLGDDSMIRGGQRYYGVSIDNGNHKMVFMRDGKGKNEKSAYQFDGGTVQKKVGRTQLPEVAENFNIRDVRMQNGSKMKINFWYQNDKPFLTDKTSGQLYEFLSLSSCDRYSRVLKTMKADEKVIESNINSITAEIDTLKIINNKKQDFIDSNEGFDDTYVKVVTMSQESKKVQELENLLQSIGLLNDRINEGKIKLSKVEEQYNKIPIDSLTIRHNSIVDLYRDTQSDIKSVEDIEKLDDNIKSMGVELENKKTALDKSVKAVESVSEKLKSVEDCDSEVSYLKSILVEHRNIEESMLNLKTDIEKIEQSMLKDEDGVSDRLIALQMYNNEMQDLISKISFIEDIRGSIEHTKEDLHGTINEIDKYDKDLEDLKNEAGYCPFCGTVFSK